MTDQVTAPPSVLLREAARIMRERMQAATPGPWWEESGVIHAPGWWADAQAGSACHPAETVSGNGLDSDADAAHIASWHPAVALAVADWLDEVAALIEFGSELNRAGEVGAALDVARVYLGRTDE